MVDGPNLNIRPTIPPPRGTDAVSPLQGPGQSRSKAAATTQATSNSPAQMSVSGERNTPAAVLDMPLSILNSAVLTRAEWGWRGFLTAFFTGLMAQEGSGSPSGTAAHPVLQSNLQGTENYGQGVTGANHPGGGPAGASAGQGRQGAESAQPLAQQSANADRSPTVPADNPPAAQANAGGALASPTGASSASSAERNLASLVGQAAGSTDTAPTQNEPVTPGSAASQTALARLRGANQTESQVSPQSTQAFGQREANANQASSPQQLSQLVSAMRQVVHQLATQPAQRSWEISLPAPVHSPTLVPFTELNGTNVVRDTSNTVQSWTLLDRFGAAVQDAETPLYGGGMVLLPTPSSEQSRAVRWRAHRSSQQTSAGHMVHRLVLDFQVHGRPARVTLITHRPEMAVYVQTNDTRLRGVLEAQSAKLQSLLSESGWSMQHFNVGVLEDDGGVTS